MHGIRRKNPRCRHNMKILAIQNQSSTTLGIPVVCIVSIIRFEQLLYLAGLWEYDHLLSSPLYPSLKVAYSYFKLWPGRTISIWNGKLPLRLWTREKIIPSSIALLFHRQSPQSNSPAVGFIQILLELYEGHPATRRRFDPRSTRISQRLHRARSRSSGTRPDQSSAPHK